MTSCRQRVSNGHDLAELKHLELKRLIVDTSIKEFEAAQENEAEYPVAGMFHTIRGQALQELLIKIGDINAT